VGGEVPQLLQGDDQGRDIAGEVTRRRAYHPRVVHHDT
jgi:hypothetical protein